MELFRLGENSFDVKYIKHQEQKKNYYSHGHASLNIKSQIVNLKCLENKLLFVATMELKKKKKTARAEVACVSERHFFVRWVEIVKDSDHPLSL